MRRILIMGLFTVSSCSSGTDIAAVTKAIGAFHSELNAGNFEQIYADSAPDWKQASPKADTAQLFTSIHNKLGGFLPTKQTGWHVNYGTGGTMVPIVDDSKFQLRPIGTGRRGDVESCNRVDADLQTRMHQTELLLSYRAL